MSPSFSLSAAYSSPAERQIGFSASAAGNTRIAAGSRTADSVPGISYLRPEP
jgi:hypothetical protein